jgi:hypothetical protein
MIKLPPLPDHLNAQWPYLPHQLRVRDIEVARCALEAAAAAVSDGYLGRIDPVCAAIIRAIKIEGETP